MAEQSVSIKRYGSELGLDITSSDIRRPAGFASDGNNFDYDEAGDLIKRSGYQIITGALASSDALFRWSGVGLTQAEKSEVILLRPAPEKLVIGEVTITYPAGDHTYKMFYDPGTSQYRAQIIDNAGPTTLLDEALGSGTGGDLTITGLTTAIGTVAGFSAVSSAEVVTAGFAAFTEALTLNRNSAGTAHFRAFSTTPLTNPGGFTQTLISPAFPASALVNDSLFMTFGEGPIGKYDGVSFYKAGLPKPDPPVLTTTGAAPLPTLLAGPDSFKYKIQYIHEDNAGNITESQLSDSATAAAVAAGARVDITFDNLTTDYNIVSTRATGATIAMTKDVPTAIPVTSNAGFLVGQKVFMKRGSLVGPSADLDQFRSDFVQGEVTATPGGITLTVSPDESFSLETGTPRGPISTGLRLAIWRTRRASLDPTLSNYFLVGDFPIVDDTPTTKIGDGWTDDDASVPIGGQPVLGDVPPDFGAPPPEGRFLANYRNHLVIAGVSNEPDLVHFSEPGRPDVFATATNSFAVGSGELADDVTGLGATEDYLMALKDHSLYRITGDLGSAFQVDRISNFVGCVSGMTVKEIDVGILGFLSHEGPWMIVRGQQVVPMGATPDGRESRLKKFFRDLKAQPDPDNGTDPTYHLDRSVGFVWPAENKYCVQLVGSGGAALKVLVYDFRKDSWSSWDPNMRNPVAVSTGGLTMPTKSQDSGDWLLFLRGNNIAKFYPKNRRDEDYNDAGLAIPFSYSTHWENAGAPSQLKKYLRATIFSLADQTFDLAVKQQINWDTTDKSNITYDFNSGEDPSVKGKFREQRARSQRLVLENSTINKRVTLSGYELELSAPFKIKVKE